MTLKIIQQGAEANIILLENNKVIKSRIRKTYRIEKLDNRIRKSRTKSETKLLNKANEIIFSPKPFFSDDKFQIIMPFIDGKKLSEYLDNFPLDKQKQICEQIGQSIAKLHNSDIIHGDLTTSNMIFVEKENKVFFIDFGLGFISHKVEDKAVDLHLLKQALEAKHFKYWEDLFEQVLRGYKSINPENLKIILERLKTVEKRGRYKIK